MSGRDKAGVDLGLTDQEKKTLLHLARTTIEARASGEPLPICEAITQPLQEKRGAFVSLHRKGQLRGCIGYISAVKPLHETIQEMALAAGFQDPRFPPLDRQELVDLDLEISVLTPLREISEINEIQVGTHGLLIVQGNHSGLLLPQVATQYGWSREEFLGQTSLKAGLPPAAWKDEKTKIFVFSADIF
jgi:AmmeMemoRadiSam system protein A